MFFTAQVLDNRPLSATTCVLRLDGCQALDSARPGQFVMVRGEWQRDPLLPRAFSLLRAGDGECQLLVKAVGRGSGRLRAATVGERLAVLGPLGRPFPSPAAGDLLVAGGVGLAPLLWLAEEAHSAGVRLDLFYGARTAAELILGEEIARTGARLHLTTEDGSKGTAGQVTMALAAFLAARAVPPTRLLTCGSNAMMKAVAALAARHQLPCLLSVEGEMACGLGACLGCAVERRPSSTEVAPFAYACVDGPVFDAARIVLP